MANLEHVAKLKQGVDAWNLWREENPEVDPDLSEANFAEAELVGVVLADANLNRVNFEGANLKGAILWHASLKGAILKGANLKGANLSGALFDGACLHNTDFREADLGWAQFKEAELWGALLNDAILQGANFEEAHLESVNFEAMTLAGVRFARARIVGGRFMGSSLQGANFQSADLHRADFKQAFLLGANFKAAILLDVNFIGAQLIAADFGGANLRGAHLGGAHLASANLANTSVTGVTYDGAMLCRGINVQGCTGSQRFVRHVMDLDYIEETKEKHPRRYIFWKWTSDCGRSWERWAMWSIGIALVFGTLFLPSVWWKDLPGWLQVVLPHLGYNVPDMEVSLYTPYYFSIVTFTTLGFGDITPLNLAGQIWLTLEVVLGYIMLGGLITLFATKMVRQSG